MRKAAGAQGAGEGTRGAAKVPGRQGAMFKRVPGAARAMAIFSPAPTQMYRFFYPLLGDLYMHISEVGQ